MYRWIYLLAFVAFFLCVLTPVSCKYCTRRKSSIQRNETSQFYACIMKYSEACSMWNPYIMCTYYRKSFCEQQFNFTYTAYTIVTVCCPGYYQTREGCRSLQDVKDGEDVPYKVREAKEEYMRKQRRPQRKAMSPGVYGGIAAASVFVLCIIIIPIYISRKKKLKQERLARGEHDEQLQMTVASDVQQSPTARGPADPKVTVVVEEAQPLNPSTSDGDEYTGGQAAVEIYNNDTGRHLVGDSAGDTPGAGSGGVATANQQDGQTFDEGVGGVTFKGDNQGDIPETDILT